MKIICKLLLVLWEKYFISKDIKKYIISYVSLLLKTIFSHNAQNNIIVDIYAAWHFNSCDQGVAIFNLNDLPAIATVRAISNCLIMIISILLENIRLHYERKCLFEVKN